ncbi:MAG: ATP-dependent sacrificial sulfur transferase LarE [Planctomycetota bacterium]
MTIAYLGLDSNLGDRQAEIHRSIEALRHSDGIKLLRQASLFETPPIGPPNQGPYLNTAVSIETGLKPHALFLQCLEVENRLGRVRGPRWGPRTIDIDLLLYGERIARQGGLIVPHAEMHKRRFVLEPLAEIAPNALHPVLQKTIQVLLRECLAEEASERNRPLPDFLQEKLDALSTYLRGLKSALVAYSGGMDSTLLALLAYREMGERSLAVTIENALQPAREREAAVAIAREFGFSHRVVTIDALAQADLVKNPPDRCYFCKREIAKRLRAIAAREGFQHILDGVNVDDAGDFRPGTRAADEAGVLHPLKTLGLGKTEIRALSRHFRLPTADKPPAACLASRIPYGQPITLKKLLAIETAEDGLFALGFRAARVRHEGRTARIELPIEAIPQASGPLSVSLVDCCKKAGFAYVALDLAGYRTGNLNEALSSDEKREAT